MQISVNEAPFCLKGLEYLEIKLMPLPLGEILRAQDGTLLYAPEDARMEIVLEGKGSVHPAFCDVKKGARFTLSHPLPLWTTLESPPRAHAGPLILRKGQKGYLPIFTCILKDFEIKTEVVDAKVAFRFVFQEV